MTPIELDSVNAESNSVKSWSPHKKKMYGMAVLANLNFSKKPIVASKLKFVNGMPIKKQKTLVASPGQAKFIQHSFEMIRNMIELDVLSLKSPVLKQKEPTDALLRFSYMIDAEPEHDTHHILHEQVALKVLGDELVLVATGDFQGKFNFYTLDENEMPVHSSFHIKGSGVYELPETAGNTVYMTERALT